jgi:hypothetical protein
MEPGVLFGLCSLCCTGQTKFVMPSSFRVISSASPPRHSYYLFFDLFDHHPLGTYCPSSNLFIGRLAYIYQSTDAVAIRIQLPVHRVIVRVPLLPRRRFSFLSAPFRGCQSAVRYFDGHHRENETRNNNEERRWRWRWLTRRFSITVSEHATSVKIYFVSNNEVL